MLDNKNVTHLTASSHMPRNQLVRKGGIVRSGLPGARVRTANKRDKPDVVRRDSWRRMCMRRRNS